ncbi:unnamed protein product [Didymodactylos carnosus]|uniref:NAD(P)(+)--arginine ADP-ribosyltransferase n=1 Tax=Didymodactylos carnosus TaxID=1234261 RepID=A0A815XXD7_9BILA|nr:unnamed protein product [Didymodactylos carnosus]CAF1562950.1 unnamed protein product [Didymodactylos carnosus]CAF4257445.1 unnamed protein product [Didymodactylos carnosus]CAF4424541.1 unnamed protein product [Didymodactylos carnosus]
MKISSPSVNTPTDFYFACRNGDIDGVIEQLEALTIDDVNRVQPNGSTPLHAACYFGHYQVVKLLLDFGASRSVLNKHGCVPYDEAKASELKQLFMRENSSRRFVDGMSSSGLTEWMRVSPNINDDAICRRVALKYCWDDSDTQRYLPRIQKEYIDFHFTNSIHHDEIQYYLRNAIKEDNPIYLLKAYTAETDFYKRLNRDLAEDIWLKYGSMKSLERIIEIVYNHSSLNQFVFKGKTYRGMKITKDDLEQYSTGTRLLNKSFLSTSKDRRIADRFALMEGVRKTEDGENIKHSAVCIYETRKDRSALDIESISEYPQEKEVLIMPFTPFKVMKITHSRASASGIPEFEIELRECKSLWIKEKWEQYKFAAVDE